MITQPLRSILIVGGGTAGWLAAAYLQRALCADPARPVAIRLVESPEVPTIGVGEATVPTLVAMMRTLGIPEPLLFARAEATLKNGIRFVGWREGGPAERDRYDHPFDLPMPHGGHLSPVHWQNLRQRGLLSAAMADCCSVQTALMDGMLSPKPLNAPPYQAPVPYGYHLDAQLLAGLLRETAVARGVVHTPGTVSAVHTGPDGITGITLADGRPLSADLYVDCTGFAGLLIDRALQVPWLSYADQLLCDRAVACPVAHPPAADAAGTPPLRPYTTATAEASGWRWEIDLQSRRGTGYVYASAHCSDDEATATLLRSHGGLTRLAEPRLLRMRIGHRARVWEKNCLALGLASGFIEPLESTGIYLIEHALAQFVDYLPGSGRATARQAMYNRLINDLYDELRDFIVLHYVLSQRRDTPFWRDATAAARISPALAELLALWDEKLPQASDINRRLSLFSAHNYAYILAGLQHLPPAGVAQAAHIDPATSDAALRQVAAVRRAALAQSPTMADYARKQRGAAALVPGHAMTGATA